MAITYAEVLDQLVIDQAAGVGGSGDYTSNATSSLTAGRLLVLTVKYGLQTAGLAIGDVPTPTSTGVTWQLAASAFCTHTDGSCGLAMWVGDTPAGGGTITIAQSSANANWDAAIGAAAVHVIEVAGAGTAGQVLASINKIENVNNHTGASRSIGAGTITLPSAPATTSIVVHAAAGDADGTQAGTTPAGYSELQDVTQGTAGLHAMVAVRDLGSASTSVAWTDFDSTGLTFDYASLAVEIDEPSGNSAAVTWTMDVTASGDAPPNPFATVAAVGGEVGTSLGTNNAQTLPTGSTTGDLVVVWVTNDNPSTTATTASTGWAQLFTGVVTGNVVRHTAFGRVLDGGANDTLSISGASQDYCVSSARIVDHGVTNATIASDIKAATPATATSGNADPPSLDAGASRQWLWLASAGVDFTSGNTISADPANYTNVDNRTSASSTSSCGQRVSRRVNETQTENPGTYTNTSQEWVAGLIAIPPSTAPPNEGTATATYTYTQTAAGARASAGTATAAYTYTATAVGDNASGGSAIAAWTQTVTAAGARTSAGTATSAHTWTATALGTHMRWPASISGRYVLDQTGRVYFMRTFSSWKMANKLTNAEITTALEGVAGNGFNGVTVWCGGIEDRAAEGDQYENQAGQSFWTGTPWRMNQGTTLGPAWATVDHIVSECARLGLTLHFSFCAGFGSEGAGPDWETATDADMHAVGVALATRYTNNPNIVWHVMFDDSTSTGSTRGLRTRALFDGINDTEGTTKRPVRWVENAQTASTQSSGWFGTSLDTRFSINGMYQYQDDSVVEVETIYAASATLGAGSTPVPCMDVEPPYDGAGHYTGNQGQQLRERSWALVLEGGVGINYGQEDWWPFGGAGLFTEGLSWTQVQAHSHTVQQSYVWALAHYYEDSTWAPSSFVTTGEGTGDTKAAVGASDTALVAYFPTNRSVVINTTSITGTDSVRIRWYDPTAGTYTVVTNSEAQQSGRSVTYPANHADGTADWVLVVDLAVAAEGSATVTAQWTVTPATGARTPKGTAAAAYTETVTAAGRKQQNGAATTAYTYTIAAAGARTSAGATSAAYVYAVTAQGQAPAAGASQGSASVAYTETTTAAGARTPKGASTPVHVHTVTAAGSRTSAGLTIAFYAYTITAAGESPPLPNREGAATVTHQHDAIATGARTSSGAAIAAHIWIVQALSPNVAPNVTGPIIAAILNPTIRATILNPGD